MKKIIGSALTATLTVVLSACGGANNGTGSNGSPGIPSTSTHIATSLSQSAEMRMNGSWTVASTSLKCGGTSKPTTTTAVYTFNSATHSGTYSVTDAVPAQYSQSMGGMSPVSMFPPMKKTVSFNITAIDGTSFSIQTKGSMQCALLDGTPCPTLFTNTANTNVPTGATIDFQYILDTSGTSVTLSVNDQTDILSCGLGNSNSSSFLASRQ